MIQNRRDYTVVPDGQCFLLLQYAGSDQAPPLDVLENWSALVKK
jgi:hypothetical protein